MSGPLGAKQVYGYDRNGRLVAASTESSEVRFERDALGRVVREWQRHEGADWVGIERAFDPDHALRALTSSLGARQSIARDALGAPVEVTCAGLATRMWRDVGGLETARETGTLRMWWTRDAAGRPRSRQVGSELQRFEWRSEARLESLETSAGLTRYEHDARGRLVGVRRSDGARQVRAHDLVGNVYQREDLRDRRYGPGGLLEQTHDATYEHDDEGRRSRKVMPDGASWRYHWDGRGQLAQVELPDGVIVENRYDALARRVQKRVRRGEEVISDTRFVWSGDRLAHEVTVANGREDKTTWYWDPESLAPLARERGGVLGAIVTDHLGTPTEIHDLDREGVAHLAWRMQLDLYGVAYVDVGDRTDCNLRWPGQYEDEETGLYENRHRHYDPATGRYISPDPIGLLGGLGLYRYVDDPLSQTDPWGLFFGRTTVVGYWTNDFQNELNAAYQSGQARVGATWPL